MIERLWYGNSLAYLLLLPFSWGYRFISWIRRSYWQYYTQEKPLVPVIVVGNLTVGGTGKTPLVIALAEHFKQKGISVGIVSRGYKAKITTFPHKVSPEEDSPALVGDEPLLMARALDCPVVIAPDRRAGVQYLIEKEGCGLILSDDGLQHYKMGRTLEIAVVDGLRKFGNGCLLPAGPLREPLKRLQSVDLKVINASQEAGYHSMNIKPQALINLHTGEVMDWDKLAQPVAAVAGIGNPDRFFLTLKELGIAYRSYIFPDHHAFKPQDLQFSEKAILMTEKDAVKCKDFILDSMYYLKVKAELEPSFWQALDKQLSAKE